MYNICLLESIDKLLWICVRVPVLLWFTLSLLSQSPPSLIVPSFPGFTLAHRGTVVLFHLREAKRWQVVCFNRGKFGPCFYLLPIIIVYQNSACSCEASSVRAGKSKWQTVSYLRIAACTGELRFALLDVRLRADSNYRFISDICSDSICKLLQSDFL